MWMEFVVTSRFCLDPPVFLTSQKHFKISIRPCNSLLDITERAEIRENERKQVKLDAKIK